MTKHMCLSSFLSKSHLKTQKNDYFLKIKCLTALETWKKYNQWTRNVEEIKSRCNWTKEKAEAEEVATHTRYGWDICESCVSLGTLGERVSVESTNTGLRAEDEITRMIKKYIENSQASYVSSSPCLWISFGWVFTSEELTGWDSWNRQKPKCSRVPANTRYPPGVYKTHAHSKNGEHWQMLKLTRVSQGTKIQENYTKITLLL